MAEIVQYHLEKMVEELEDLERRGLFSKDELRMVVKRRTKFEYNLRRRRVQRADFLRYIEYELNVDALRRQRKKRQGQHQGGKATVSDYSVTQRVISIFERALVRHPEDAELWLEYMAFVKARRRLGEAAEEGEGYSALLGRLFVRAISAHPYEPQMWLKAATHELNVNANGSAARALLQRALRLNPDSMRLWTEYFRLELLLVEKIKARRRVLGIDGTDAGQPVADKDDQGDEEGAAIELPLLDEEEEERANGSIEERFAEQALAQQSARGAALSEEERAAMNQKDNAYLQGAVAQVVFEQAVRAVPGSLAFRQELAAVAGQFPDMEAVQQRVLESIAADFGQDAQARGFLCVAHLAAVPAESPALVDALQRAVQQFGAALAALDTPAMWAQYVAFLVQWQHACGADGGVASLRAYFAALLGRAARAIGEQRDTRLNAELALACADTVGAAGGDVEDWLADATQRFPESADLWHRRLAALIDSGSAARGVESLFRDGALAHVPQSRKLWEQWADWLESRFAAGQVPAASVQAQYLAAFARITQHRAAHATRNGGTGAAALVAVAARLQVRYVDWMWSLTPSQTPSQTTLGGAADESDDDEAAAAAVVPPPSEGGGNVEALRLACRSVERQAFPTLAFYRRCLALEPDAGRRATLHEMACRVDEADPKPWIAYLRFLAGEKLLERAAGVYWRASNAVPEADRPALEASYQKTLHSN
ncbi:U3 snoRNP protein [Coemansia spiralis]|nr:U3 snoRNP protein [Coemansia spiralis]